MSLSFLFFRKILNLPEILLQIFISGGSMFIKKITTFYQCTLMFLLWTAHCEEQYGRIFSKIMMSTAIQEEYGRDLYPWSYLSPRRKYQNYWGWFHSIYHVPDEEKELALSNPVNSKEEQENGSGDSSPAQYFNCSSQAFQNY